jgi:dihydrofolate reductase
VNYTLIAAVARNGVIGMDGRLPWHLPSDLKFFREQTMGKVVVMGRTTFDGIAKPLPGRRIAVLTRRDFEDILIDDKTWVRGYSSLEELAFHHAKEPEIMVAGGAQIYALYLPIASRQLLTEVDCEPVGDSYYPTWPRQNWELKSELKSSVDSPLPYRIETWVARPSET